MELPGTYLYIDYITALTFFCPTTLLYFLVHTVQDSGKNYLLQRLTSSHFETDNSRLSFRWTAWRSWTGELCLSAMTSTCSRSISKENRSKKFPLHWFGEVCLTFPKNPQANAYIRFLPCPGCPYLRISFQITFAESCTHKFMNRNKKRKDEKLGLWCCI